MTTAQETCECGLGEGRHCYHEAARELGITVTWLQRHIKKLPRSKVGRTVYFTDADLTRIDELFHHEPTAVKETAVTSSATAMPRPVTALRPLPSRSQKQASRRG